MNSKSRRILLLLTAASLATTFRASAQTASAPAPAPAEAPAPLTTPAVTGPLQWQPPAMFDAGPFGKLAVNGIVSGFAQGQNNPVSGDDTKQATLTNGQIFIQKADGKVQYFIEAGAYALPSLGTPFLSAEKTIDDLFGPVPVAFLKLQTGKTTSWQIGSLPTLMGAEGIFSFQNMNIERGLVWNQENVVNKGIQVNQTLGKYLSASLSWNDGFDSNRYSWLSGALTFIKGPHSLILEGAGNAGQTKFQTVATPVLNNSSMYAAIYTYTKGAWIVQPYYQYTTVPTNAKVGVADGASTNGGAILVSRTFKGGFSLPVRFESIAASGSTAKNSVNLLYGPGSSATSFTATPTYQKGGFFTRFDVSYVHAGSIVKGSAFGKAGADDGQFRAVGEFGFIFGSNIASK